MLNLDFIRRFTGTKSAPDMVRPLQSRSGAGVPFALIGSGGIAGDDVPQSYDAQVRGLFCKNAVAQAALRLVTDAVGEIEMTASDARVAALIAAPSAGQALLETLAAHLLLHGNAYVQVVEDGAGGIAELYALRPERVTVDAGPDGWPGAYLYRIGSSVSRLVPYDAAGLPTIIHLKSVHPADDHYGLGCLGAAASAMAIHNAAARWNKALLDNAARPSGALIHEGANGSLLTGDQFERLKTEMSAHYAGAINAGRPLLLDGNLKWQTMSLTPADMDFVALKDAAAREIAMAFGVPPMLLGLPGDATYANYKEANRALWRNRIVPLANRLLTGLAHGLAGWFVDGEGGNAPTPRPSHRLSLRVNMNHIPALAEERERLWTQVGGADFLTREEKRALVGLDVDNNQNG